MDYIYKKNPIIPQSPVIYNDSHLSTPLQYVVETPQPKVHKSTILSSELMDEYLNTLITQGSVFLKYKAKKPPKTRIVLF